MGNRKNSSRMVVGDRSLLSETERAAEWRVVERFIMDRCDKRHWRPQTVTSYRNTLLYLWEWTGGVSLFVLTVDDLIAFVNRPRHDAVSANTRSGAAATVRREGAIVKGFFRWLLLFEKRRPYVEDLGMYLEDWKTGKVVLDKPNPVGDSDFLAIWAMNTGDDDRFWLGMMYLMGLRTLEVAMLEPWCIDSPEEGAMTFYRKGRWDAPPHTLHYEDLLLDLRPYFSWLHEPIDEFIKLIPKMAASRSDMKWLGAHIQGEVVQVDSHTTAEQPSQVDRNWYGKRLVTLKRTAGLPKEAAAPHRLRHSAATNLYRSGLDFEVIANRMHHATMEMTRKYAEVSRAYVAEHSRNRLKRGGMG